ncbi:MAG: c-type cytochrome [Magnetococcales bacterium]|nr:c-type cytochrome [Magnetococcales bacterium]
MTVWSSCARPCFVLLFGVLLGWLTVVTETWASEPRNEPVLPIPTCTAMDGEKVRLGKRLYHDVRLSANNSVSCATCHPLDGWGMDGIPVSTRVDGVANTVNTPTVFNALFNIGLFWNGRVTSLEDQIEEAVRVEMGATWNDVLRKISQDESYRQSFARVYRGGIQAVNIRDALAEFERLLITPNSRFDRYLRGEDQAITPEEKQGYELFKKLGCISCHQGVNLGGNLFHRSGIFPRQEMGQETAAAPPEPDRMAVTGNKEDAEVFKVPSLRNVTRTAPYFHHGQVKTLEEAVTLMARGQLGRIISVQERDLLVGFLRTLEGTLYGECR